MSDADNFGIRYSNKYESTYKRILKEHYRKDSAGMNQFEDLIDKVEEVLVVNPYPTNSVKEPWPGKFGHPDCNLCKIKLRMPALKGASRLGRLLYLVDRRERTIYFLWVYTHQEFSAQPPTKDIKEAVKEVVRHFDN